MSAIFPYVGFNYSFSAPCLGGLSILRSPEKLPGQVQGIIQEASRPETDFEENGLALGNGNNPEQIAAPLDKNSAEVVQADTKHNEGARRLNSRIPKKLGCLCLTVATGLIFLSGYIFDAFSKREPNTELLQKLLQTQGVEQSYVINGEDGELNVYVPLKATDVPYGMNGKDFQHPVRTTVPIEPQN